MKPKPLVIYVAGPYRAATQEGIDANVRAAALVGQEILRRGHACLCPHTMTHNWDQGTGLADEVFLESDIRLLARCDAICMVGDWRQSRGAVGEYRYAVADDLTVFLSIDDVPEVDS